MTRRERICSFFALAAIFCLASAAAPSGAVLRTSGEYWTYELTTAITLDSATVPVNGSVTYRCDGERALTINGTEVQVLALSVEGELDGTSAWMGQAVRAHVVLEGSSYESLASAGKVKEETTLWVSGSIGSGDFFTAVDLEARSTEVYSPGWLQEFHPEQALPGATWVEVVLVDSSSSTERMGTVVQSYHESFTESLSVSISHFVDTVATPAGEFDALKLTVVSDRGGMDIYWWSGEVGNFVRHEAYDSGSGSPSLTMVLKEFGSARRGAEMLAAVLVGVGAAALASVVLASVLFSKRRPPKDS